MDLVDHPLADGRHNSATPNLATSANDTQTLQKATSPDPFDQTMHTIVPADGTRAAISPAFDRYTSPAGRYPTGRNEGWEAAYERQRELRWKVKTEKDLDGWRGGKVCVVIVKASVLA